MSAGAAVPADSPLAWTRVRKFIAGYASGVSLVLAGHPFDTIKVRMQTEGASGRFKGVFDCVKTTVTKEGVRGLYKGMLTPLLMTGFVNSLLFGMQYNFVGEIARLRGHSHAVLSDTCLAAVASGAIISIVVTPMEGIKARLQVQYSNAGKDAYKGPVDCATRVYQKLGLRNGIFRGWLPVCLCRMSNYAYFGSYAVISASLAQIVHGDDPAAGTAGAKKLPFIASFLAGGSSGICYWLSCYPIDLVKNKMQAAPDIYPPKFAGMRDAFRSVYRAEGIRGFFVGFTPCALRAFPANAAAFLGFEAAMRLIPE